MAATAALLQLVPFDRPLSRRLVAATLTRALSKALLPRPPLSDVPRRDLPRVHVALRGPQELVEEVWRTMRQARGFVAVRAAGPEGGASGGPRQRLRVSLAARADALEVEAALVKAGGPPSRWTGRQRWASPWSALPPLAAIIFALLTRRVVLSIVLGVLCGALVQQLGGPSGAGQQLLAALLAPWRTLVYLFEAGSSRFALYVLGFTFALCGMVGVAGRAGGNLGIVKGIAGVASDPRRTRLAVALMGLAIFFEDYANAIVVGQTARPLTDAMRISREKLAYLVDSTSAPVAGVALVSSWIGWEAGLFQGVADELGLMSRGYQMFLAAVPFRFYCFFALLLLFTTTLLRRDFGAMLRAERRAFHEGLLLRPGARPPVSDHERQLAPPEGITPRWTTTGGPVLLLLAAVVLGMIASGSARLAAAGVPLSLTWSHLRRSFTLGDNGPVLLTAALLGSACVAVLALLQRGPPPPGGRRGPRLLAGRAVLAAWVAGGWASLPALAILVAAKALQGACNDLSTSAFLVALLARGVPPLLLPLATFLTAAAVAFATGTSWGTMGILIPAVGPLAWHSGGESLMLIVLAAVLDGAIFGDHCSPISDTTIMSSLSSRCDHVDHVRSQAPYAVAAMVIAGSVGYLGVHLGLSTPAILLVGLALLVGGLLLFGEDPERRLA